MIALLVPETPPSDTDVMKCSKIRCGCGFVASGTCIESADAQWNTHVTYMRSAARDFMNDKDCLTDWLIESADNKPKRG